MMKNVNICIIGGKLQGLEACYLAKKENWYITLVDKNDDCCARSFADKFICANVLVDNIQNQIKDCDYILPVIEDDIVLCEIDALSQRVGIKMLHDKNAYNISSSKLKSDEFFSLHNIPAPKYYPLGDFPMIVKPSSQSGSIGVKKVYSELELNKIIEDSDGDELVIQEYLEGKSYSIEVVGNKKFCSPLQITEIKIDKYYDCNRVEAGVNLTQQQKNQMYQIAKTLGEKLEIDGVFDIETILHGDTMKVLEIDARLPSQTPIAVYNSTGINILKEIIYSRECINIPREKYVIFEHILVNNAQKTIDFLGEHIIGACGNLELIEGFFGANEGITNFSQNLNEWVATLIFVSDISLDDAQSKHEATINKIKNELFV